MRISVPSWSCGSLQTGNTRHSFYRCTSSRHILSRAFTACTLNTAEAPSVSTFQDQPSTSGRTNETPLAGHQGLSQTQLQRNRVLISRLQGKLILAPLTKGGNVPFRRLCASFGAEASMSEMSYARNLVKGNVVERTHLRQAANEDCFGVQIATKQIDEGIAAGLMAADAGATWLDLNCGCPIYEATRRGLGAALLRKPTKLGRLVAGIAEGIPIPLTVKIRSGESASRINVMQVSEALQNAGAAAVTIHGRTMEQRYKRAADWGLVQQAANHLTVPVIGNGDVLTFYEASRRMSEHECIAVMTGRGALIKPWLFQEFKEQRELNPSTLERVGIYYQLVSYMKEHFGDDAKGRKKAFYFLPWHFNFLCRYRSLPEEVYASKSREHPLIATRVETADANLGETLESLSHLERLLRCESEEAHEQVAAALWDSTSEQDAAAQLEKIAADSILEWEAAAAPSRDDREGRIDENRG
ncbi:hypothetical protein ABBQ32_013490 [Trebouxia sp. C0010 RCD-2024]